MATSPQRFEVHSTGVDGRWVVSTDLREVAEHIARTWIEQGRSDVRIIKVEDRPID